MAGFKWTTESAATELRALIDQVPFLKNMRRRSAAHVEWGLRTESLLDQVFGRSSIYYENFQTLSWEREGTMLVHAFNAKAEIEHEHQTAYVEQMDAASGLLRAALSDLERQGIDNVYQGKNTSPESSAIIRVLALIEHKLRKTIRQEPTTERAVQDAVETLLIASDVEYAREIVHIEYSSKSYVPDFTMSKLDLALEVKLCNTSKREKEMVAEINDDILAYKQKYGNLLFAIYDIGQIRDGDRFKSHFEQQAQVVVQIVKH